MSTNQRGGGGQAAGEAAALLSVGVIFSLVT